MTQAERLSKGIAESRMDIGLQAQQKMLDYLALLQKWNKVYNLTAVRDPLDMVTLHLLDSLSVLPYIKAKNLLDVGSGAGLPGIVLAICMPDLQVTTIDTVQKKTIFMRQVKGELGLHNLTVMHDRVENFKADDKFEVIISRAFSEIGLLIRLSKHLLAKDGKWLAMKGAVPHDELTGTQSQIVPLKVAGLDAERHLIIIENNE
jgi:16S rRNA (guanine527-N7)-methyltransferase